MTGKLLASGSKILANQAKCTRAVNRGVQLASVLCQATGTLARLQTTALRALGQRETDAQGLFPPNATEAGSHRAGAR